MAERFSTAVHDFGSGELLGEGWIGENTLILSMKPHKPAVDHWRGVKEYGSRMLNVVNQFVKTKKFWLEWRRDCVVLWWVESES